MSLFAYIIFKILGWTYLARCPLSHTKNIQVSRIQRKREKQCWTEQSKSHNGFDGHRWAVLVFLRCSEKVCFFPQNIKSRDLQPEAELVKPHSSPLLCETESNAADIQTTALLQFLSLHSLQTQTEASSSHSLIHDSPLSSTGSFIREALSTLWLKSISI